MEGNASLFLSTLNTFYLWSYGVGHIVKDHSVNKAGKPFATSRKEIFYIYLPIDMIIHPRAFVTPVVEHWLGLELTQWVHQKEGRKCFI